jgi:RecG-like helicase
MLTAEAASRLRALREFSALGDGFELAQADMALRGCGNLLGPEQSGQVNDVGAEFFFEMLEEAIATARARADGELEPTSAERRGRASDEEDEGDVDDDEVNDDDLADAAAWLAESSESDYPPPRR